MRSLLALAAGLLSVALLSCGGSDKGPGQTSHDSAASLVRARGSGDAGLAGAGPGSTAGIPQPQGRLKGDVDDDDSAAGSGQGDASKDRDGDLDDDTNNGWSKAYYDRDDDPIRTFGRAASAAETRLIAAIVERYYAAGLKGDGARGCALMYPGLVEIVPEDFGEGAGPAYARGKTCAIVMSKIFRHARRQLPAGRFEVVAVRVQNRHAYVLMGSTGMPASFITLKRAGNTWGIDDLLGGPLP